jgi:hypothetical protein
LNTTKQQKTITKTMLINAAIVETMENFGGSTTKAKCEPT